MKLTDGNWALKILALALAIIIYHTLKTDSPSKTESASKDKSSHDTPLYQTR